MENCISRAETVWNAFASTYDPDSKTMQRFSNDYDSDSDASEDKPYGDSNLDDDKPETRVSRQVTAA